MHYWQFLIATTVAFTLWGVFLGGGAWRVPALALAAYLVMRVLVLLPYPFLEISAGFLWICTGAAMIALGGVIPGFCYTLAGIVYPLLSPFGLKIDAWSVPVVISEALALVALLSMFVGLAGGLRSFDAGRGGGSAGPLDWVAGHSLGLAQNKEGGL